MMSTMTGGEVVGRRERKKLATRAALSEAALRLAVEHGVEHVTAEHIADEADVAVRTFFNYFSSKEEAVVAGDLGTSGSLAAAFTERPRDEPLSDSLREATLALVRGEEFRDRRRVEQMRAVRRAPSLLPHRLAAYAEQEQALTDAVAARTGSDVEHDVLPALAAATAMAAMRVAVLRWLTHGVDELDRPGLVELVEDVFAHLASGLGASTQ